jgi:hypothetical protein
MNSNVWRWYLVAVVAVGQYYFVSAAGAVPNGTIYSALGVTAVVAMVAGILIHRPRHSIAWVLATIGFALFLAGDYVYADLAASQVFVPFPSTADWLYLAMYPVLALGIVILGRRLAPHRSWKAAGVGVVTAIATAGVLHLLYMGEYIADPFFDTQMRFVAVAYPVLDAVMFGLAAWLVVIARRQSPSLVMVALGLASMVVGNAVYNVQAIDGSFAAGGFVDLFWIAFAALLGLACLHPSTKSSAISATSATSATVVETGSAPVVETGSAPVVASESAPVVASESALAEIDRRSRFDFPVTAERERSASKSRTGV